MHRGPREHLGSLRRRLDQAGLAFLCVARNPVQPSRLPYGVRHRAPSVTRLVIMLVMLLHAVVLLFGSSSSHLMPSQPTGPAHGTEPPRVIPIAHRSTTELATVQNIEDLAQILMSEASPGVANTAECTAVGYTVRNRMRLRDAVTVRDVWDAYAHHAVPTDNLRTLAAQVLRGEILDPTGGATHFYSPRSMPMEGDSLHGFDTSGGLEHTRGLHRKNYRPGWAAQYNLVVVAGARASHYKFYRQVDPTYQ